MKIKKIRMENFRQFYGVQELNLSVDDEKNVTLIMAENGVGKTTILNAILWCFYEQTTDRFEGKDKIVNLEAKREHVTNAKVEVYFEHEGIEFFAQRVYREGRNRVQKRSFHVYEIVNGIARGMDDAVAVMFINSVVPKDMAPYFFFDGEHAESFAAEQNRRNVGKAIRAILGCTLLEAAAKDLRHEDKYYASVIAQRASQSDYDKIQKSIDSKVDLLDQAKAYLEKSEESCAEAAKHLEKISSRLLEAEGVRELEEERRSLTKSIGELDATRIRLRKQRADLIANFGHYFVISKRLADLEEFLAGQERQGYIPSPYNEEFVRALLTNQQCICGCKLEAGSDAWQKVMALVEKAPTATSQGRLVRVRALISSAKRLSKDFVQKLQDASRALDENAGSKRRAEQRLSALQEQLDGINVAEIKDLEAARRRFQAKLDEEKTKRLQLTAQIGNLELELENLKESRRRIEQENERVKPLVLRRRLAELAAERFEQVTKVHEERARHAITDKVNAILAATARRDYEVSVADDFSIDLRFKGASSPKSGGENQLLSLAFISALIDYAADRARESDDLLIPGTVAPLVLDSPFGQLDSKYRGSTAQFVPKLAGQVVLLLSSSQADQSVLQSLHPYVGKCYALVAHTTSKSVEGVDMLETPFGVRPGLIKGADRDLTEIVEVAAE